MSASSRTRTAVSLPVRVAASSMSWIWPRPWIVATCSRGAPRSTAPAAEPAGEGEAEHLLGVHVELRAEAAADGRGDHAQLVLGDAGDGREHQP